VLSPDNHPDQYTGVAGGLYAFNQPLKQYTEDQKTSHNDVRRSSSNQPQPGAASGGASPAPALHTGGSTATSAEAPTIAGASPDARRGNSVDHDVKLRSKSDAKQHDGTGGGGMGVAEMRERKMAGQGLPSPQVSTHIDRGLRRSTLFRYLSLWNRYSWWLSLTLRGFTGRRHQA